MPALVAVEATPLLYLLIGASVFPASCCWQRNPSDQVLPQWGEDPPRGAAQGEMCGETGQDSGFLLNSLSLLDPSYLAQGCASQSGKNWTLPEVSSAGM